MNRLAKLIDGLHREELLLVQKDLDTGNIERLIAAKLAALSEQQEKNCPICGARTHPKEGLVLEFGPMDLRQRAVFDGPDCLQFFVTQRFQKH